LNPDLHADFLQALSIELLRQLSQDTSVLLGQLTFWAGPTQAKGGRLSYEDFWKLTRPLIRVLLWVLPEHVPEATSATSPLPITGAEFVRAVATVGAEGRVCLQIASLLLEHSAPYSIIM
jgi:hypothetical protein